jgi:hypothetical protein
MLMVRSPRRSPQKSTSVVKIGLGDPTFDDHQVDEQVDGQAERDVTRDLLANPRLRPCSWYYCLVFSST